MKSCAIRGEKKSALMDVCRGCEIDGGGPLKKKVITPMPRGKRGEV